MSPPRSLMEFDLHARVLRETYRDLLGIQDGVEADARFLAFCRGYVHVYDESYRTLHASLGSQQDPRSLMEFDLQVRVMRETYRKLLGIRDGLEADARFLAFCRQYVHVNDDRYRTLHAYLASQQDPSPASPTISISSAPPVMSSNPSTPQSSSSSSSSRI